MAIALLTVVLSLLIMSGLTSVLKLLMDELCGSENH